MSNANTSVLVSAALAAILVALVTGETLAITIPTVPVGNPGNAPDPLTSNNPEIGSQYGDVSYAYRIGTTEVTNAQYAAFLNEKAKSDPLGLYDTHMDSDARGGITQSGVSPNFSYSAKADMGNKPVNYVNWYDSIRFTNWLNNGQGIGDTETGAYTLGALGAGGVPTGGSSIAREAGATWVIPSENEWYKAAFHQPAAQGGDADNYWLYPTASNNSPMTATANLVGDISNPGANVANYANGADWNSRDGNVTTVGSAGPLSQSFYGTSDQGGNIWEWTEALIDGIEERVLRGGSLAHADALYLESHYRPYSSPLDARDLIGFRVATVPEPSSLILAAAGLLCLVVRGWQRKRAK